MERDKAKRRQEDNIKNRPKNIHELDPTSSGEFKILDFFLCEHINEHQASIPAGTSFFKDRSTLRNSLFN
jgi:hypothetical protein